MLLDATKQIERGGEVVGPDIAPVDHTCRQKFASWKPMLGDEIEVLRPPHEIEPDTIYRQRGQGRVGLPDVPEGGLQQELGGTLGLCENGVGTFQGGEVIYREIEHKSRFVELNPLRAARGKPLDSFNIGREERVEK